MLHIRNARRDNSAIHAFALFGIPAQQIDSDAKFDPGFADRLAHFTRQIGTDILEPVLKMTGSLFQNRLAAVRGHLAPDVKAVKAALQRRIKISRAGMWQRS